MALHEASHNMMMHTENEVLPRRVNDQADVIHVTPAIEIIVVDIGPGVRRAPVKLLNDERYYLTERFFGASIKHVHTGSQHIHSTLRQDIGRL